VKNRNIIIAGGDGFCGWPLALRLSKKNYNVIIIDNFKRRKIDKELKTNSITPIKSLKKRIFYWEKISGKKIRFYKLDVSKDIETLKKIIKRYSPKAIYMFAEYKSAPYSMLSLKHSNLNFSNNLISNNNLLSLIKDFSPKTHYIHLGTMGVYGYDLSKKKIPEGYFKAILINKENQKQQMEILHPANPGSIYHLTKSQDELIFQFYQKTYGLKITDLHQGIVWGCNTYETNLHPYLINRFDYDHIYGTFLNRMISQLVIKHPFTLHGKGKQKRAFININDAVKSYELVLNQNSFKKVNIFNEVGQIMTLTEIISFLNNIRENKVNNIKNPRIENEENYLEVSNKKLINKGLKITKVTRKNILELISIAEKYKKNINYKKILTNHSWKAK